VYGSPAHLLPDLDVTHSSIPKKVGIVGGVFNPVHLGHLLIAECALDQFELDQVVWVVADVPPHKTDLLPFDQRWEMVRQAIADHPNFVASDVERNTRSYASETFAALQMRYPQTQWYWILGSDAFQKLAGWYHSDKLAVACTWLVAPRNSVELSQIARQVSTQFSSRSITLRWHQLEMPQIQISSSLVRQYCQEGRSLRYLVPEPVRTFIRINNFYQVILPTG